MALAPFFDKAALAAAAVLRGFDRSRFAAILREHVVGIAFDDEAARVSEGRITLELAINLLARLYPRIALVPLQEAAVEYVAELTKVARAINPAIEFLEETSLVTVCLAVGHTQARLSAPTVHVGSDGWVVGVSSRHALGSGDSNNPFGAAASACFGAANIFRLIFADQLPAGHPDNEFRLSLLDMDPGEGKPQNPALDSVALENTHLVGAGAIGNGALWILARIPELSGILHVIDGETLDDTNPQRYVLATLADTEKSKVDIATQAVEATGSSLEIRPYFQRWGSYLATLNAPWDLDLVATALDSGEDRIAVQAALPQRVVNAWTQEGDLGISRHNLLGDGACLACLYLPEPADKNEDQLVAEAIGLPEDLLEIRKLLHTGEPVGEEMIRHIATALEVDEKPLRHYAGRPLRDFYSEAICGGLVLRLQGGVNLRSGIEVPMAFQSALAGVLLAVEIVRESAGMPAPAGSKVVIDLLRPLEQHLTVPIAKHGSGRCICQDPDFQAAFRAKALCLSAEEV